MLFHGLWQHTVSIPGKVFLIRVSSPRRRRRRQKRGRTTEAALYHRLLWHNIVGTLTVRFCWRFLMIIFITMTVTVCAVCRFQQDLLAVALRLLHSVIRPNGSQMCVIGSVLLVYACSAVPLLEPLTCQHIACWRAFHFAAVSWFIPDSRASVGPVECGIFKVNLREDKV